MSTANVWRPLRKATLLGALGTLSLLLAGVGAPAQEAKQDKDGKDKEGKQDDPPVKRGALVRSGYTRPGNPPDRVKNGKVIPVFYDDEAPKIKKILGGTV